MTPGTSASMHATKDAARAHQLRARADGLDRRSTAWAKGAHGERSVAAELVKLLPEGFYLLNDRAFPNSRANVDHLLIGPPGVFVVDAKNWDGELNVSGGRLLLGERSQQSKLDVLRDLSAKVGESLDASGLWPRAGVTPVMCFAGTAQLDQATDRTGLQRVALVNVSSLVDFVASLPVKLERSSVEATVAWLRINFPPRTASDGPHTAATVQATLLAASQETTAPDGDVYFLTYWRKYGKRNLYVKTADGSAIGHLNLVDGTVSNTLPAHTDLLCRLLAAFHGSDIDEPMTTEATSVFQRFVAMVLGRRPATPPAPVIAVRVWRKYGKTRLYVNRVDANGTKHQLGSINPDSGMQQCAPSDQALFDYCMTAYGLVKRRSFD